MKIERDPAGRASFLEGVGYLAGWSSCYTTGCTMLAGLLLGIESLWKPAITAFSTTMFVYLLHRLRRVVMVDGPDTSRLRFLSRHPLLLSVLLGMSCSIAVLSAWYLDPWAELLVFGAPLGMVIYGTGSPGRRPKDQLVLKNALVAVAITVFSIGLVLLEHGQEVQLLPVAFIGMFLFINVFVDAMLCDIDDVHIDVQTRTSTIPRLVGIHRTFLLAEALVIISSIFILVVAGRDWIPLQDAFIYPLLLIIGIGLLHGIVQRSGTAGKPGGGMAIVRFFSLSNRDLVDIKLPLCVLAAWGVLQGVGSFSGPPA